MSGCRFVRVCLNVRSVARTLLCVSQVCVWLGECRFVSVWLSVIPGASTSLCVS